MRKGLSAFLAASLLLSTLFTGLPAGAATALAAETVQLPAFPGAEGGGKYTSGGRGGAVYEVTTLADSGPGSLREAVSQSNTTVVFRVGGTIHLEAPLKITGSNLTIAGQTAPGEGITVSDYTTSIEADNVIVRYMRFRLGDKHPSEDDAFGGRYHKDLIIDHSSFSWSVDEVLSMYVNENTTVQWSIVAESMLMTSHQKGRHGYAGIWGGNNASFHHNLIAHNVSRNPRFAGSPDFPTEAYNNIVYNWGFFSAYGGEQGNYNLRNNYYKYGPSTYRSAREQLFLAVSADTRIYIDGNVMDGSPEVTADNWLGVGDVENPDSVLTSPVVMPNPSEPDTALVAYDRVLEGAGAVLPRRDAADARVVADVKNGTGRHINSQKEVGGYPEFAPAESLLADSDHDGMPDEWEIAAGLNPADPEDRNGIHASGYTNLEVYLNGIAGNGSANPEAVISFPADNTVVTEGSAVEIQAEASDSDGSVAKVEFYRNDVLLGEDTTAPYSFTWDNVQDGTYFLTVRAVDDTGTSTQSDNVAVHVNRPGSIQPWQSADVGAPGIPGHTQLGAAEGDVTVKSAGDIAGTMDHFHYAYQELAGNGEIVARVDSITATDDEAEGGVMIRSSLDASAPFAALMTSYVKYGKKTVSLSRSTAGFEAARFEPEAFINTPYWVKMVRLGDQITSLASADGAEWSVIDTVTLSLPDTVYFGLAADAAKVDDDVYKYNATNFSRAAVRQLPADFPAAPSGVTAEAAVKAVNLSWNEVPVAAGYNVLRGEMPGGPFTAIANGVTETAYTDSGLVTGKTYYYVITAENASGTSFHSAVVSAVPEGEPETVYYVDDDFEATANGTLPTGYTYTPDPQDAEHKVEVFDIPAGTAGNDSSKALLLYDNAAGSTEFVRKFTPQKGKFILEADIASPGWPGTATVLNLQDESGGKTALSFQIRKPTAPAAGSDYTLVYKKSGADYKLTDPPVNNRWYSLKLIVNVPAKTADIYIDNTLVEDNAPLENDLSASGIGRISAKTPGTGKGTLYYDNLKIYVEPAESPNGLTAIPGNGKVKLEWNAAEGASTYTVKRSTADGGPYQAVAEGITEVSYIDETVQNDTAYYYVVTAIGSTGESGPSSQVSATPSTAAVTPDAPLGLTASGRSAQVDLTWQNVDHAIRYTVKRSLYPEGPFAVISASVTENAFRDTGLSNGTAYYYAVSATSIGGEGPDSAMASATPAAHLTTPAVSVQPLAGGVGLEWEAISGAASYEVKRAADIEGPYTVIATVTESAYADYGLRQGSPNYYKVAALNEYTHSLDSAASGARPAALPGHPSAPAGLTASPQDGGIALSWEAVPGAEAYTVRRGASLSGPFITVAGELTGTAYTDSGLVNGIRYYYLVSATNDAGEGDSSSLVHEVPAPVLTVAADGSGEYTKVQAAIDAVPANSAIPTIIRIQDGIYREKLDLASQKIKVRLIGESREGTVLVYGDAASTPDASGNPLGTSNSYSLRVQASDFTAEHLTIQNDAGISAGQAVALYANADRLVLRDVSLRGHQDTLYANNGRQYYVDSYIEGTVDFIFGNATAIFENTTLHSLGGGYLTAASTGADKTGYIFIDCRVTAETGITGVALGRPWRANANVIYINTELGGHIAPAGWNNWSNADNEKTARYGEFASYGPGADPASRSGWTKQLSPEEAALYTPALVLAGSDGWNPAALTGMADSGRALSELKVDGSTLPGLDPAVTRYTVEAELAEAVPFVAAAASSPLAVVTVTQAAAVPGTAVITVAAQDGSTVTYTVEFRAKAPADTKPPVLRLSVDKPVLKANGHRMEPIHVTADVYDEDSGVAAVTLLSITSNEDDDGHGDGHTKNDIQGAAFGTADFDFELRAERSGRGQGRVYTITYEAVDFAGNRTTASVTVTVKH